MTLTAWAAALWLRITKPVSSAPSAPPAPPAIISKAKEEPIMSDATVILRDAGFGPALDAVEDVEKAVGLLTSPEGLTAANVSSLANKAAAATVAVTSAAQTVAANPVGTGFMLAEDAVGVLTPVILAALTKKAGTAGTIAISTIPTLLTEFQAIIGKL